MRYLLSGWVHRLMPPGFPYGTLAVNVVGSLVAGFLVGVLAARSQSREQLAPLFLIVGVCGGFTTFSAFSVETYQLVDSGAVLPAALNVVLQVAGSLAAVFAGFWLSRQV
jgi:CrcB protein